MVYLEDVRDVTRIGVDAVAIRLRVRDTPSNVRERSADGGRGTLVWPPSRRSPGGVRKPTAKAWRLWSRSSSARTAEAVLVTTGPLSLRLERTTDRVGRTITIACRLSPRNAIPNRRRIVPPMSGSKTARATTPRGAVSPPALPRLRSGVVSRPRSPAGRIRACHGDTTPPRVARRCLRAA